jgi:hypothetical protein
MERVPNLSWPSDLFAAANSTAPLLGRKTLPADMLCACGCRLPHKNAVSRVIEEDGPFGYNRRIAWYANIRCRNAHMGISQAIHHGRKT